MRKHFLAAGIAAVALIPTLGMAQQTCEERRNTRIVGTVGGAGVGALLGSAIAGRDNRTAGALIGGIGGAIAGNQLTRSNADCTHAYGYYDSAGQWHANVIDRANAAGYYDRDGQWVDGAPNGYYGPQGRWISADTNPTASGYYDSDREWVPASAGGYYGANGQWIAGTTSGHYDNGRWIAGPSIGRYDDAGRWISGQAGGHRDANGAWVADAQPGYYDTAGRWRPGTVVGYYDTQGRWIGAVNREPTPVSYPVDDHRSPWADAPQDLHAREAWLDRRIRNGVNDGALTRQDGYAALRSLNSIRRQEMGMRHYRGRLNPRAQSYIQAKLDDLVAGLHWSHRL